MRRRLVFVLALALVGAGTALAERGDPQERIKTVDQARARAMLLRPADLPGWRTTPSSQEDDDAYCRALDESDLTLTGKAESRSFQLGLAIVSSEARVFATSADASASWRRGTGAAGVKCLRDLVREELRKDGDRLVSFAKAAAPRVAQRSARFAIVAETQGIHIHLEMVVLMQSRAHAAVLVGSGLQPFPKTELNRLSRVVAARMKAAMRRA